jgi:hypothetical protein
MGSERATVSCTLFKRWQARVVPDWPRPVMAMLRPARILPTLLERLLSHVELARTP